jgi:hypothetical protein
VNILAHIVKVFRLSVYQSKLVDKTTELNLTEFIHINYNTHFIHAYQCTANGDVSNVRIPRRIHEIKILEKNVDG